MAVIKTSIWQNKRIIDAANATISAVSAAALYGRGVFTTAAVAGGRVFLWEKHWRRLAGNAILLGIDISEYGEAEVLDAVGQLIRANELLDGKVRITFFDQGTAGAWKYDGERGTGLLITAAEKQQVKDVLKLTVSPYPVNSTSPLAGIKSCNYLENLMAYEAVRKGGFDEAVRLNERGEITGGCLANIFWQKREEIFTPGLRTGCLPGTTREYFMENNICREVKAELNELTDADRIFMTSAGLGIAECELPNSVVQV